MKQINYNPDALSHHNENIQYWVTQGIVIDGEKYSIEEFFTRSGDLYGVLSKDKKTFYEHKLSSASSGVKYDDKELVDRITNLEKREIPKYDDTGINKRLSDIESKDNTEISNIKTRLELIENKPDNDNQTLSISDHTISISGGNSITIPSYPKYDDSNVKKRLQDLENKPDNDNQTLSISDHTISISGGNSITIPSYTEYDDSDVKNRLSVLENKKDNDTVYDDTNLRNRIVALESKQDNDNQTLTLNDRTISISGGNSITLPEDKGAIQTLSLDGNNLSISDGNTVKIPNINYNVTSTTEGVTVSSTQSDDNKTFNINIDQALSNYYDKTKTYTKDEVKKLIDDQEKKSTDITVYRGTFANREIVQEGTFDTDRSPRITLTYSSSTGVGILKVDFKILKPVGQATVIANLPKGSPVPAELIEAQVWVGDVSTSIWVDKGADVIRMYGTSDAHIFNKRIILNIPGIFKKR